MTYTSSEPGAYAAWTFVAHCMPLAEAARAAPTAQVFRDALASHPAWSALSPKPEARAPYHEVSALLDDGLGPYSRAVRQAVAVELSQPTHQLPSLKALLDCVHVADAEYAARKETLLTQRPDNKGMLPPRFKLSRKYARHKYALAKLEAEWATSRDSYIKATVQAERLRLRLIAQNIAVPLTLLTDIISGNGVWNFDNDDDDLDLMAPWRSAGILTGLAMGLNGTLFIPFFPFFPLLKSVSDRDPPPRLSFVLAPLIGIAIAPGALAMLTGSVLSMLPRALAAGIGIGIAKAGEARTRRRAEMSFAPR